MALVALGCVVRGDTRHFEHVADTSADALMRVALDSGVPVLNGILAVDRFEDAEARAYDPTVVFVESDDNTEFRVGHEIAGHTGIPTAVTAA